MVQARRMLVLDSATTSDACTPLRRHGGGWRHATAVKSFSRWDKRLLFAEPGLQGKQTAG